MNRHLLRLPRAGASLIAGRPTRDPDPSPGRSALRWSAWAGVLLGAAVALAANLPAAWLAAALGQASGGRLQLAEAQGTVWQGSALPLLTGGPGSRDLAVLPSRLVWRLAPFWGGLRLQLSQDCCMTGLLVLEWRPGWGQQTLSVLPASESIGQWPAAWLEGLGAPWNTVKPGGQLRLASRGLVLKLQDGVLRIAGAVELTLLEAASRLSTVNPLGNYQLTLAGPPAAQAQAPAKLTLRTLDGALLLAGQGEWRPRGLVFRGQGRAAPGQEPALNNLLNIIGQRQGALSVISIG